jgi:hypothetical protein
MRTSPTASQCSFTLLFWFVRHSSPPLACEKPITGSSLPAAVAEALAPPPDGDWLATLLHAESTSARAPIAVTVRLPAMLWILLPRCLSVTSDVDSGWGARRP